MKLWIRRKLRKFLGISDLEDLTIEFMKEIINELNKLRLEKEE